MLKEENYCHRIIKKHFNKPFAMTEEEEENFKNEKFCHICNKKYKINNNQ